MSQRVVNGASGIFLSAADVTAFLQRKKREMPLVPPKITGDMEAGIIVLACGKVPAGYTGWTLWLLVEECVELNYSDSMSNMTISQIL